MKLYLLAGLPLVLGAALAQDVSTQARDLKRQGDFAAARALLEREAQQGGVTALQALAEFLDLHKDPEARGAYGKLAAAVPPNSEIRREALRRLIILDLIAGDSQAASRHIEEYRAAGGAPLALPPPQPAEAPKETISIPGPLRSFSRMAALSPDLKPEDVLPALARNIVTNGYQASGGAESLEQTEYLKLVFRYLSQAREIEKLAGPSKILRVPACESAETAELLRILGYRMRGGCGSEVVLETVNATRAFLTIDSGFPLAELEQALRANRPFEYDFRPAQIPVLFSADYWRPARERQGQEFIDTFLSDPSVCRLYLGMSKLDPETAAALRNAMPVSRIRSFAHVLDFFGGMFEIRNGKAAVPGGERSAKAWAELVGVSPDQGAQFYERLIMRDDGWMASFYDALMRLHGPVRDYLTEPNRMKRFYAAIRGRVTSPGPARPVFRSNTDMLLLTTRLRVGPDGKPVIPGSLDVWKNLFVNHPQGKYDGKLTRAASAWKDPDDLIEALFGLCRKAVENEPLKIFMALSELDRRRKTPMAPETVDRLARSYRTYGAQYPILAESPSLTDASIKLFMDTAQAVTQIRDQGLRSDTAGTLQALVGIWQILVRQGSIPDAEADATFSALLSSFGKVRNSRDVFDAGVASVRLLLKAARVPPNVSPQDAMIDLLAGAVNPRDTDTHTQVVQDMMRIFEAQRLVSLKTIFDLEEHLSSVVRGEKLNVALVNRLAARIADIQLPRSALTGSERNSFAFGYWVERHIDAQRKLNLRSAVEKAGNDPEKLKDLRGLLAPILRDTLVGFNYVHYAPPGAQVLMTNPLFVRGHDFIGIQGSQQTWKHTEVFGSGWPSNAGGRLVGSLSSLPYALAEAEQNFLIPRREQALIWGDLVPQMILTAKIPRWWNVTPGQLHWVGLHLRFAESAIAEAVFSPDLRSKALGTLARYAPPARVHHVASLLAAGNVKSAIEHITPAEAYALARELVTSGWNGAGPLGGEIRRLAQAAPDEVSDQAISRAFGTPKPTLTNSYRPELLSLRTFPTLMGYSSRIMAESWESNLLYYAALADEIGAQPSQLNVLVPEWTQKTVEQIFATHLEDWPALLRSLRVIGDEVRSKSRALVAAAQAAQ